MCLKDSYFDQHQNYIHYILEFANACTIILRHTMISVIQRLVCNEMKSLM